ncbi:MAG TPA: SdpI family protein [Chitinophagaceae bacterium]|nr:SdpI family protein [Chitinophagaceae bacterium]
MNKFLNRTVGLIIIVPLIYLAVVWNKLPERIAMHFDIRGNADQFDSKNEFLWFSLVMLVVSLGTYLLLTNIWRIDPKKYAAENKERLQKIGFALVTFLSAVECIVIYTSLKGSLKLDLRLMFALIGLFWAVIANYMNNLRPNYFAGFRLPWTLENEENWRRTHHLASKLWFVGGLLITVICIFTTTTFSIISIFSILTIVTVIPVVYSYRFYRKQKKSSFN